MKTPRIRPVRQSSFTAEAIVEGPEMEVLFVGTADGTAREALDSFLLDVHREASHTAVGSVVVDVSGLEFISSSCLTALVSWIGAVRAMARQRYQISFFFRTPRAWHGRCFGVLARLGDGSVAIRQGS